MNSTTTSPRTGPFRPPWPLGGWETAVLLAITATIAFQLFVPPIVGVADNGDYHRVMAPLGLEPTVTEWSDRYFDHVNLAYRNIPPSTGPFPTSQIWLGRIARAIDDLLGRDDSFRLTSLGAVNAAVYLAGILLVLFHLGRLPWASRLVGGVFLFLATTDVSNVSFFNSFYSESASLAFLACLIGLYLVCNDKERIRPWHLLAYFAVGAAFVAAKPQNHPLVVPVLLVPLTWLARRPRMANLIAYAVGGLALLAFTTHLYTSVSPRLKSYNCWNVLYFSLLADSPDPRADLAEFGLPPELAQYAGQGAFAEGVPLEAGTHGVDHGELARFFVRHPDRFWSLASRCAEQTYVKLDPVNGHFEKSSGRAAREQSDSVSFWYRMQASVLPRSIGWLVFQALMLVGAATWVLIRRGPASVPGGVASLALGLGLMAALQFVICVLGDGVYDIVKHLFVFQVLLDACFLIGMTWFVGVAKQLILALEGGDG